MAACCIEVLKQGVKPAEGNEWPETSSRFETSTSRSLLPPSIKHIAMPWPAQVRSGNQLLFYGVTTAWRDQFESFNPSTRPLSWTSLGRMHLTHHSFANNDMCLYAFLVYTGPPQPETSDWMVTLWMGTCRVFFYLPPYGKSHENFFWSLSLTF